jgi:hypothetical protein
MFINSKINQLFKLLYCTRASNVDENPQKKYQTHGGQQTQFIDD